MSMNTTISWDDYASMEGGGFGTTTQADVDALTKALSAGQEINPPGAVTPGDGFALRVESLDRTLRNTTFKMEHIKLYKQLMKAAAYNTVNRFFRVLTGTWGTAAWA